MRSSISLGSIGGVRIGLNWSVLVIVAILVFGLALGSFPLAYPGYPTVVYLLAGLVAAVLFLGSLLAHEVAHAMVARHHGIEVAGITLWLLGGVAQLRGEPRTPGADLRIAGVGPLVSLLAGVFFGILALLSGTFGAPLLITGLFAYLGGVNVLLAVFNMIPAAPLDGGRVLRAFLWLRWGDRSRAAVAAARAGRGFGYALIALGLLLLVTGIGFQGLWLALIGLFLVNAASAEEQHVTMGTALHGIRVGDVMSDQLVVASPEETVDQLIDRAVLRHRLSTYPLIGPGGHFAGLVTLNRVRATAPETRATTPLREIACPAEEVPVAREDEPLVDLLPRMSGCADGRAVVLDPDGRLIGLITPSDISRIMQTAGLRAAAPYASRRGADLAPPYTDPAGPADQPVEPRPTSNRSS
ncbi:site-2 protease family protein [Thermostaphylospora chromogena]|uniref:Zinc metalloprotease n=1 Tax=Thermostaphylospora chromogena TaxID=35622 RepID=A0A1H1D945_9ACTN|nr:site-2 protease family protein [Thermostaphylospora chromogena]SDQ73075.1 Zn-dependent protease (includes SpoIVFB) [Thermostaphylospora chromogena]